MSDARYWAATKRADAPLVAVPPERAALLVLAGTEMEPLGGVPTVIRYASGARAVPRVANVAVVTPWLHRNCRVNVFAVVSTSETLAVPKLPPDPERRASSVKTKFGGPAS